MVKVQEKDERFFQQNTNSNQSKKTSFYTNLYTKITLNYLKLLNHKLQAN